MRHRLKPESNLNVLRDSAYCGFGIVLSFSCIVTHSILKITLCSKFYHHSHFPYGKMMCTGYTAIGFIRFTCLELPRRLQVNLSCQYLPYTCTCVSQFKAKPRLTEPWLRRHKSQSLPKQIKVQTAFDHNSICCQKCDMLSVIISLIFCTQPKCRKLSFYIKIYDDRLNSDP